MNRLSVWLRTEAGALRQAGEIRVDAPDPTRGGALRGEFRYQDGYLDDLAAIALDPLHLPLASGTFSADRPRAGVHGVFEDSLPDDWGRGLLIRRHRLPRMRQRVPDLLGYLGEHGLGALAYGTEEQQPTAAPPPVKGSQALIEAAERYEDDPDSVEDEELGALFRAASSPGGARPKLVIEDAGRLCIAKLRSRRDRIDMVRVEAACLALARQAGLLVPGFRVETFGRYAALLVDRFDVCGVDAHGRRHMLSMHSLLGADDWYQLGYSDLADLIRQVSSRPETDLPALYRQAVFNALIGNTDDHLKNFSMLHRAEGWRLAPAYDLTPDEPPRGEHVLHFGLGGYRPSQAGLSGLARGFGLSALAARRIQADVADAVRQWRRCFADYGVGGEDIDRLAPTVTRRLRDCAGVT